MSNGVSVFRRKRILTVGIILISFFSLTMVILASTFRTRLDKITPEDNVSAATYQSEINYGYFRPIEISVLLTIKGYYNDTMDTSISYPFENSTIKIYDGNGIELDYELNNKKRIYICNTKEVSITISEPEYTYYYEIVMRIKHFSILNSFLISFSVYIVFFLICLYIIIYRTARERFDEATKPIIFSDFDITADQGMPLIESRTYPELSEDISSLVMSNCPICKMEIRTHHQLLQRNSCLSLFHKDHLVEWLKHDSRCPVCQKRIIHD
ncbi:MAG: hypothetical protein FK734_08255 [Asgard group archaeon]|nr:hypothetical protein [Asgard group archaeon]